MTEQSNNVKNFISDAEVRWCPGCGDYAILKSIQTFLPTLGFPREKIVFISGIGCAGRFPYYVNTYGFHTIHGRAPAIATGLKLTRPDLSVWIITGDGDGLSIGGNHLIHLLRRNLNINVLLFNNRIYGLTKGQYSPTSEQGKVTSTTPQGSIDYPLDPIRLALGAGATFVARGLDVDVKGLHQIYEQAVAHQGTSFIEVYQNCNVFNDGTFAGFSHKKARSDNTLWLEDGAPLLFGNNKEKGVVINHFKPEVQSVNDANHQQVIQSHDASNAQLAYLLSGMYYPEFPVPLGIFHRIEKPTYESQISATNSEHLTQSQLQTLFTSGQTWHVS